MKMIVYITLSKKELLRFNYRYVSRIFGNFHIWKKEVHRQTAINPTPNFFHFPSHQI